MDKKNRFQSSQIIKTKRTEYQRKNHILEGDGRVKTMDAIALLSLAATTYTCRSRNDARSMGEMKFWRNSCFMMIVRVSFAKTLNTKKKKEQREAKYKMTFGVLESITRE